MATKKKTDSKLQVERLEYDYMRLDELLQCRWDLNPKLHQTAMIHQSITDYGFNDPVGFDVKWRLVLEGHGRLEDLDARYRVRAEAGAEAVPQHIDVDSKDGMWLVPVTKKSFPSRETALLYALAHNRTNTARYVPEDYDPVKMQKIRQMLGDAGQMKLAGFEAEDSIASGVGMGDFVIPDLKPFDSIDLPDGAGAEGTAPESFVMMVTFRTFMEMKESLRVLTLGERTTLSQNARLSKFDGSPFLARWRAMMAGEGMEQVLKEEMAKEATPAPLLEWRATDHPSKVPVTPDPAWQERGAPVGYSATEMEVGASLEPAPNGDDPPDWDTGVPLNDPFYAEAQPKTKKKGAGLAVNEAPRWVSGLCAECGGNGGLNGNPAKGTCPSCGGYGEEYKWLQRNTAQQGSLL